MDINCIKFTANLKTNKLINKNKNKLTSIKQQQQQQVLRQLNGKEKLAKHGKVCLVAVK